MYNVPQDLKAKAQITHGINFSDFIVALAGGLIGYFLSSTLGLVADKFTVVFNIFNILVVLYMIIPSSWNRGKKNYQSILYALVNDKYTYHTKEYPVHSNESLLDTPLLDNEVKLAAVKENVDLDAIRKEEEDARLEGLR